MPNGSLEQRTPQKIASGQRNGELIAAPEYFLMFHTY
jgi:hypothetical protein